MNTRPVFRLHPRAHAVALMAIGLAAAAAAPAFAQTATPPSATAADTGPGPGPGRLADVIVTAQKVAQPAGKAAISITAIGGDELRTSGATNAVALSTLMPNVQISAGSSGSTDISIRGIVSTDRKSVV